MKKTAVIYARFSSDRQTEQSIEGQLRECMAYAESHDIRVVDTYIDRAMSGTNDNRDSFQQMLRDAKSRPWDHVIVYKLDRFSRNKYEMAIHRKSLTDNGITLISATEHIPEGPEGIILESLLEGMAQYYSMELAQKVRRGQKETRIKGKYTGGPVTYGYRIVDGRFVVDEYEARVVRMVFDLYNQGLYMKTIAKRLDEAGYKYRGGKRFCKSTISRMLANEKYTGVYNHKTEGAYTNIYPRIIPEELFREVQTITEANKKGKHVEEVVYLLKMKMKCGYCGGTMVSDSGTGRDGRIFRYYSCGHKKRKEAVCHKKAVRKEAIEKLIVDATIDGLASNGSLDKISADIAKCYEEKKAENAHLTFLKKEEARIKTAIANLMRAMEQGIVTASTKERLEELDGELEECRGHILVEEAREKLVITAEDVRRFIGDALREEPRQMLRLLIREIILYDDRVEIYYNYTDNKRPDGDDHQAFCFYEKAIPIDAAPFGFGYDRINTYMHIKLLVKVTR